MNLIISFFLSVIVYSLIVGFFFFFLLPKKSNPHKEVLIHTAIIPSTINSPTVKKTPAKSVKVTKKAVKKSSKKKRGSKSSVTTGGSVSFKDIFKNVKENIDTTKIKRTKQSQMSRFKGLEKIEKNLKKVKAVNFDVSVTSSGGKKSDVDKIVQKIGEIWYEISDIPGEYAKINVTNKNGDIEVIILDSNLNADKQIELIEKIKELDFKDNFSLNIKFQTKVNK
ncbi:MAG: hypothetical protein GXO62_08605 [Epsilonproteobacteria bacterium]|nr:hypothetical protein [Campylobacterota bacterium]